MGSSSKVSYSKGFWKESSNRRSKKLWSPAGSVDQNLDRDRDIFLNGFSKSSLHRSFAMKRGKLKEKIRKKLWQLSPSLVSTPRNETENYTYTRKIRFYPTDSQKKLFESCFGATRYLINKVIEGINNKTITDFSFFALRKKVILTDKELVLPENKKELWLKAIPSDTKQLAIRRLAVDIKPNIEKVKKKQIKQFRLHFKSKKNIHQYCFVDKRTLKASTLQIFPRRTKEPFKLRSKTETWWRDNLTEIESSFTVIREKNRYYFCLPMTQTKKKITQPYHCVALDPGVRTFQTFYSEDVGVAGKLGNGIDKTLFQIAKKEDKLKSFIDTTSFEDAKVVLRSKRHRYNLKKRCFLLRTKIKNIVNDLHWKSCHYLCSNFKNIFLPEFGVKNMTKKSPSRFRAISSNTTRSMLTLSHYKFKERLLYKSQTMGCKVHICNESYTTKTCGKCGNIQHVGRKEVFLCTKCEFKIDRDYNGARNIYLKVIEELIPD